MVFPASCSNLARVRVFTKCFGPCKWLVICGVLIWILGQINVFFPFLPEDITKESLFFEPLQNFGAYLFEQINTDKNPIDEIAPILQQS